MLLIMSILNNWKTKKIDIVMAYPQAKIQCPMYMELPQGFEVQGSRRDHALLLHNNIMDRSKQHGYGMTDSRKAS